MHLGLLIHRKGDSQTDLTETCVNDVDRNSSHIREDTLRLVSERRDTFVLLIQYEMTLGHLAGQSKGKGKRMYE